MIFALINIVILLITGIYCINKAFAKNNKTLTILGIMCFVTSFQLMMFMLVYIVDHYRLFGRII